MNLFQELLQKKSHFFYLPLRSGIPTGKKQLSQRNWIFAYNQFLPLKSDYIKNLNFKFLNPYLNFYHNFLSKVFENINKTIHISDIFKTEETCKVKTRESYMESVQIYVEFSWHKFCCLSISQKLFMQISFFLHDFCINVLKNTVNLPNKNFFGVPYQFSFHNLLKLKLCKLLLSKLRRNFYFK